MRSIFVDIVIVRQLSVMVSLNERICPSSLQLFVHSMMRRHSSETIKT